MIKNNSILKSSIIIMMLILIGKVVAFGKDIIVSSFFGVSMETDALFIALNITSILFVAFYSTVSLVFLPLYTEQKIRYKAKETNIFVSNIINLYLLISLSIMLLSIIFAPQIVELVNGSSNILNKNLSIDLLRIMTLSFLFSIFISFMTSIQLSNNQYLYMHFIPIINNSIIVLAIILFAPKYGIYVPAIAGVIAWGIQVPFHKWITRTFFHYSFHLDLKDKNLQKMGFLFLPAFLGISIDQANIMVDTMLASSLQEGSVSALNYSNRLISFSSGIFIMAIMSIMYPMFSKYVVNGEIDRLGQAIQKSMRLLLLVMVPITAIIIVYHQEIVSIVFQRGKFDMDATTTTASVFFFYGLGIIFLALRELFNKVFYAQQNTKTPLFISFISVSINIILSIILVKSMGVEGLAFASSISLFVYVVLQILILKNKIGKEFYYGITSYTIKLLFSISIAIVLMWQYKEFGYFENIYLSFTSGSLVGMLTYIIILFFIKNEDITKTYIALKSKIVKKM